MSSLERITACENICRDFFWAGSLLEWLQHIVVIIGVIFAWRQLKEWRNEKRATRRSEVSEEMIAAALNVDDAFKDIRSPLTRVPLDEVKNKTYTYEYRYKKIGSYSDTFNVLRNAQIRCRAVIGDKKVDQSADELFKARNQIIIALEMLGEYARDESGLESAEDRELKRKLRATISGSTPDKDELAKSIANAVATIESQLTPITRLEKAP